MASVGGVGSLLSNPQVSFRLDPGEPGVIRGARATDATIRVAAQEKRNAVRLTAEAVREGRVVTRRDVSFDMARVGDVIAATGGQTTVVSRPDTTPGIVPATELPVTNPRAVPETGSLETPRDRSIEVVMLTGASSVNVAQLGLSPDGNAFMPSSDLIDVQHGLNVFQFRQAFPQTGTTIDVVHVEGDEQDAEAPVVEDSGPEIETFA